MVFQLLTPCILCSAYVYIVYVRFIWDLSVRQRFCAHAHRHVRAYWWWIQISEASARSVRGMERQQLKDHRFSVQHVAAVAINASSLPSSATVATASAGLGAWTYQNDDEWISNNCKICALKLSEIRNSIKYTPHDYVILMALCVHNTENQTTAMLIFNQLISRVWRVKRAQRARQSNASHRKKRRRILDEYDERKKMKSLRWAMCLCVCLFGVRAKSVY